MRFAFDSEQPHQLAAVNAVVDLFRGHGHVGPRSTVAEVPGSGAVQATPNRMTLPESRLLENLRDVQSRSEKPLTPGGMDSALAEICRQFPDDEKSGMLAGKTVRFPNFSVEMETGTGKTYVYLRTIRELAKLCGFLKFIVVVPSVAVREGVLHAMRATDSHLTDACGINCESVRYDSSRMGRVSAFARATTPQAMVVTIDSVKRDDVLLLRSSEGLVGETPLHFIQAARPILILDEPQNMETKDSHVALARLNPLFALRYSATHKRGYNMVHRLSPMEAYRAGLVKTLIVEGVEVKGTTLPRIRLVDADSIVQSARVEVETPKGKRRVTMKPNDRLDEKTGLAAYRGYQLEGIWRGEKVADFCGGDILLRPGESHGGGDKSQMFRAQIRATIKTHFLRQRELRKRGIKVLSLFFIDKVDNYRGDGEGENAPLIRRIFEEEFDRLKTGEWKNIPAASVHNGYFAKSIGGNSEADALAYQLIMRDKESLLTFANPKTDDKETLAKRQVAFIFTHSALREGWDNPNIFQICTLNETMSDTRKRQEIGRGVRLAVDQDGARILDGSVNMLTVIPNGNYQAYVEEYQSEMAEDYRDFVRERLGPLGAQTPEERKWAAEYKASLSQKPIRRGKIKKARANPLHIKKGRDGKDKFSAAFIKLWERIRTRTEYMVNLDGPALADAAGKRLTVKNVSEPQIVRTGAKVVVNDAGDYEAHPVGQETEAFMDDAPLPDLAEAVNGVLEKHSSPLRLSRATICRVIRADLARAAANPYEWSKCAAAALREALTDTLRDGVVYEKAKDGHYEWRALVKREFPIVSKHIARMRKAENAAYNAFACDVKSEVAFAKALAKRKKDVKLFLKLPREFKVQTPLGGYNPDWAILFTDKDGGEKLVLVAETKERVDDDGNIMSDIISPAEEAKIHCAAAHFGSKRLRKKGALEGTDFLPLKNAGQLPFQSGPNSPTSKAKGESR